MTVRPWAKQAIRATVGSSSIMAGMTEPWITVPWRLLERTSRSAVAQSAVVLVYKGQVSSHGLTDRKKAGAGGIDPTFLMSTSELGRIILRRQSTRRRRYPRGRVIRFP